MDPQSLYLERDLKLEFHRVKVACDKGLFHEQHSKLLVTLPVKPVQGSKKFFQYIEDFDIIS